MCLGDDQVTRLRPLVFDVGPGRVEMGVVGNHVAGLDHRGEEDSLGGPSLVGGYDLGEAGHALDGVAEPVEGAAAGIRLVALHHPCPLGGRHRPRSRIRQQIDDHLVAVEAEEVEPGPVEGGGSLLGGWEVDRLDGVDAKRLDDRSVWQRDSRFSGPERSTDLPTTLRGEGAPGVLLMAQFRSWAAGQTCSV